VLFPEKCKFEVYEAGETKGSAGLRTPSGIKWSVYSK